MQTADRELGFGPSASKLPRITRISPKLASNFTNPILLATYGSSQHLDRMTNTPKLLPPLDSREQPILDSLTKIREDLTQLKQDRSTYIKSSDVVDLYDKVVEQVRQLNAIRANKPQEHNQGQHKHFKSL